MTTTIGLVVKETIFYIERECVFNWPELPRTYGLTNMTNCSHKKISIDTLKGTSLRLLQKH